MSATPKLEYDQDYQESFTVKSSDAKATDLVMKISDAKVTSPPESPVAKAAAGMEATLNSLIIDFRIDRQSRFIKHEVESTNKTSKDLGSAMLATNAGFLGVCYFPAPVDEQSKWEEQLDLAPLFKPLDPTLSSDLDLTVPLQFRIDAIQVKDGKTLVTVSASGDKILSIPLHVKGAPKNAKPLTVQISVISTSIVDAADGVVVSGTSKIATVYQSETTVQQETSTTLNRI
jgi:hypothetical protein